MGWGRYTADRRETAVRRVLEEGWTVHAAAASIGAADSTISAWVRRRREESGFPTPRNPSRRRTERQKFEAARLVLDEGRTFAGAAREVGVAPSTARRWAHEAQQQAPRTTAQRANASLRAQTEALRLVAEEGFGPRQVARQLGLSLSAVVGWVRHGNVR